MKKRTCLLALAFAWLFVGCSTNDWDLLEYNNTWEASLSQCVQDYSSQLSKSGVSLVKKELLTDNSIDSTSFLKSNEFCFPVYYKSYDRFDPVPLSFLEKDSVTSHVSIQTIRNRVHDCLKHQNDYQFVELEWSCDDVFTFNTIAVFDRYSHELVYDNLLGNIITKNVLDNRHKVLTRSEIQIIIEEDECVEHAVVKSAHYTINSLFDSTLDLDIKVWGYWKRTINMNANGQIVSFYFDWFKTYDLGTPTANIIESNFLTSRWLYENMSTKNLISYRYLVWVGTYSDYYETFNFTDVALTKNIPYIDTYNGYLEACHVEFRPSHPDYCF